MEVVKNYQRKTLVERLLKRILQPGKSFERRFYMT